MENANPIHLYTSDDGHIRLQVALEQETVWLTQAQMAELFDKDVRTINEHIGNIYDEEELTRAATIRKFRIVRQEGKRQVNRELEHYNLDVIISVGYRVKSRRGVQFRQWATQTLRQHLVAGYTLHEKRLQERGIEIGQALALLQQTLTHQALVNAEGAAVLAVIQDYAKSWSLRKASPLPAPARTECARSPSMTCLPRWPTSKPRSSPRVRRLHSLPRCAATASPRPLPPSSRALATTSFIRT